MLADVRLIVGPTEARLIVKHDDSIVEDELWKFGRRLRKEEAREMAHALFAAAYDMVNFVAHGE